MHKIWMISLVMVITFISIISCTEKNTSMNAEEELTLNDQIGLSKKELVFDRTNNIENITTRGTAWKICSFVDIKDYTFIQNAESNTGTDTTIFTYDWISVLKIGLNGLKISVSENTTGKERAIAIQLEAEDYFDYVHIVQKAK